MSADTRTTIDMPGIMSGMWLDSLGNTNIEFVPKLMCRFPAQAEIDATSTAESLRPSLIEPGTLLCLTAAAPAPQRGRELFVYNVEGARSIADSPRINWIPTRKTRQMAHEGSLELLRSFGGHSTAATTLKFLPSELQRESSEDLVDLLLTRSATSLARDRNAETRFEAAFQRASEELFEDGMESVFTSELQSLVEVYGLESAAILTRLLETKHLSAEVWAEAMRWIGRVESAIPRESRLWLLEKGLSSASPSVRDGAIVGLAWMNEPSARPYLERALDVEPSEELRRDIKQVLSQIKN